MLRFTFLSQTWILEWMYCNIDLGVWVWVITIRHDIYFASYPDVQPLWRDSDTNNSMNSTLNVHFFRNLKCQNHKKKNVCELYRQTRAWSLLETLIQWKITINRRWRSVQTITFVLEVSSSFNISRYVELPPLVSHTYTHFSVLPDLRNYLKGMSKA